MFGKHLADDLQLLRTLGIWVGVVVVPIVMDDASIFKIFDVALC